MALGAGLLALVAAVWLLWTAWSAFSAVTDLDAAVDEMTAAADARDLDATLSAVQRMSEASVRLDDTTSGLAWRAVSHAPVVNDEARGLAALAAGLRPATDAVAQAIGLVDQGLVVGDRIDITKVRRLSEHTIQASETMPDLRRGAVLLRDSDLSSVAIRAQGVVDRVDEYAPLLDRAVEWLNAAPEALGASEQRNYLVVFENNAEIRATGGLPGSAAWLTVGDGRLEMRETFSPIVKTGETGATYDFTVEERTLYGDDLDINAIFLNSMPDSRRVGELLAEGWGQWFPQQQLDGVVTLDTVSLAYLLEATGSIKVGGVQLSSDNAVEELLYGAYVRLPDNDDQDAFFGQVSQRVFERLTDSPEPGPLAGAVDRMVEERRLAITMLEPELSAIEVAPFGDEPDGVVTVGLNNVSGDKMTYFLRHRVSISPRCEGGGAELVVDASSESPAEVEGLPARLLERNRENPSLTGHWNPVPLGHFLIRLVVEVPAGMTINGVRADGVPVEVVRVGGADGHKASWLLELSPGQTRRAVVALGGSVSDELQTAVTPPIAEESASGVFPTGCR